MEMSARESYKIQYHQMNYGQVRSLSATKPLSFAPSRTQPIVSWQTQGLVSPKRSIANLTAAQANQSSSYTHDVHEFVKLNNPPTNKPLTFNLATPNKIKKGNLNRQASKAGGNNEQPTPSSFFELSQQGSFLNENRAYTEQNELKKGSIMYGVGQHKFETTHTKQQFNFTPVRQKTGFGNDTSNQKVEDEQRTKFERVSSFLNNEKRHSREIQQPLQTIETMQKTINSKNAQIRELRNREQQLKSETKEGQRRLKQNQESVQLKLQQQQNAKLLEEIEISQTNLREARQKNTILQAQIQGLNEAKTEMAKQLESEKQKGKSVCDVLQAQIRELETEVNQVKETKESEQLRLKKIIEVQNQKLEEKIKNQQVDQSQINMLLMRLQTYQHSSDQLTQSYRVMEADFKAKETEIKALKAQLKDINSRRQGEAQQWTNRSAVLLKQNQDLEGKLAQLKARNCALERELVLSRNRTTEQLRLKQEVQMLQAELANRDESVTVLRKTIEQRQKLYSELNTAYVEQSQQVDRLTEENAEIRTINANKDKESFKQQRRENELSAKITQHQRQITDLNNSLAQKVTMQKNHQAAYRQLQEQSDRLNEALNEMRTQLKKTSELYTKIVSEKEEQEDKCLWLDSECQKLKQALYKQEKQYKSEIMQGNKSIQVLESKVSSMSSSCIVLQKELSFVKKESQQKEGLLKRYASIEVDLQRTKQESNLLSSQLREKSEVELKYEELNHELDQINTKLTLKDAQIEVALKKNEELVKANSEIVAENERSRYLLKEKIDEVERQKTQITEYWEEKIKQLQNSNGETEATLRLTINKLIQTNQKEELQYQVKIKQLEQKLTSQEQIHTNQMEQIKKITSKQWQQKLTEEVDKVQKDLGVREEEFKSKIKELRDEMDFLMRVFEQNQEKHISQMAELTASKDKQRDSIVETLQSANSALKSELELLKIEQAKPEVSLSSSEVKEWLSYSELPESAQSGSKVGKFPSAPELSDAVTYIEVDKEGLLYLCELVGIETTNDNILNRVIRETEILVRQYSSANRLGGYYLELLDMFGIDPQGQCQQTLLTEITAFKQNLQMVLERVREEQQRCQNLRNKQRQAHKAFKSNKRKKEKLEEENAILLTLNEDLTATVMAMTAKLLNNRYKIKEVMEMTSCVPPPSRVHSDQNESVEGEPGQQAVVEGVS